MIDYIHQLDLDLTFFFLSLYFEDSWDKAYKGHILAGKQINLKTIQALSNKSIADIPISPTLKHLGGPDLCMSQMAKSGQLKTKRVC